MEKHILLPRETKPVTFQLDSPIEPKNLFTVDFEKIYGYWGVAGCWCAIDGHKIPIADGKHIHCLPNFDTAKKISPVTISAAPNATIVSNDKMYWLAERVSVDDICADSYPAEVIYGIAAKSAMARMNFYEMLKIERPQKLETAPKVFSVFKNAYL